eukprot:511723-Amphidinium_carterae.1
MKERPSQGEYTDFACKMSPERLKDILPQNPHLQSLLARVNWQPNQTHFPGILRFSILAPSSSLETKPCRLLLKP